MFDGILIHVSVQNTFGAVSQRKDDSVVEFWQPSGKSMKQRLKNIAMTVRWLTVRSRRARRYLLLGSTRLLKGCFCLVNDDTPSGHDFAIKH